ncbi:MAG: RsmB/NOP family class I SAM-dependent RNA methyltransferase [Candidatus Odinarchaeota archaeon]
MKNMRELLAAEILASVEKNNSTVRKEFRIRDEDPAAPHFRELDIQARGAAFSLAIETVRRLNVLDRIINRVLVNNIYFTTGARGRKFPVNSVKNLSLFECAVFRVSTYRMLFEGHPAPLVTNTALECLKGKTITGSIEEANRLLRAIEQVELENIHALAADEAERLGMITFHRTWFARRMIEEMGPEQARAFLESCNENPPVYFRINTLKNVMEVKERLNEKGVIFRPDTDLDDLHVLESTVIPLPRLKAFKEGDFYIQAKSSALVAHVLDPQPGEWILDACAAPGGKTLHVAARSDYRSRILATDISESRLAQMNLNLAKYGVTNIEKRVHDFRNPLPEAVKFDRVLVDAPCTGSGTFQSRPEGKWRMKKRLVQFYSKLQRKILENTIQLVKEGGKLLYATCSVFRAENEEIIGWVLEEYPEFRSVEQEPFIGEQTESKGQRLFPHLHGTEGFCLFLLERRN